MPASLADVRSMLSQVAATSDATRPTASRRCASRSRCSTSRSAVRSSAGEAAAPCSPQALAGPAARDGGQLRPRGPYDRPTVARTTWRAGQRGKGRGPNRSSSSTIARQADRSSIVRPARPVAVTVLCAGGQRPGGGTQRRVAGRQGDLGGVPRRRRRCRVRAGGRPGAISRRLGRSTAARRAASASRTRRARADRLGAQRRRPRPARWITADMAYRRAALSRVGGFDERFPRAYREDADLALRVREAGFRLVRASATVEHPVRRRRGGSAFGPGGQRRRHADAPPSTAGTGGTGRGGPRAGSPARCDDRGRPGRRRSRCAPAAGAAGSRRRCRRVCGWPVRRSLRVRRIRPGPRTAAEIAAMIVTSVAIPPVATWHRGRGWLRARRLMPADGRPRCCSTATARSSRRAVQRRSRRVVPVPGAREALDRLRRRGRPARR